MGKIYAVREGRQTGIFHTWGECEAQVKGFKGAKFKSFNTMEEAMAFIDNASSKTDLETTASSLSVTRATDEDVRLYLKNLSSGSTNAVAFVDGSFNTETGVYGAGVILYDPINDTLIKIEEDGSGKAASMRNVAGEILAATEAMKYCILNNISSLDIYYDYQGIESWATGDWKTNNENTRTYKELCDTLREVLTLRYHHVDGHSGVFGNEYVDRMAKHACGVD